MKKSLIILLSILVTFSCRKSNELPINEIPAICQACVEKYSQPLSLICNKSNYLHEHLDTSRINIIGLGESTHGSKSEMLIKTELLSYFIDNHSFKKVFYESHFLHFERINANLLFDSQVTQYFNKIDFWTVRTKEVLQQIKLLSAKKLIDEEIEVYGMDFQNPIFALTELKNKVPEILLKNLESIELVLNSSRTLSPEQLQYINSRKNEILKYSKGKIDRKNYLEIEELFRWAFLAINLGYLERDSLMAERVLQYSGNSNSIIIGHSEHINKRYGTVGGHLDKKINYLSIATVFYSGEYRAWNKNSLDSNRAKIPPDHSIEHYLNKLNLRNCILNIKELVTEEKCRKAFKRVTMRTIGSVAKDMQFQEKQLLKEFDFIIFIKESTVSEPT